jgi:hypothetical protein
MPDERRRRAPRAGGIAADKRRVALDEVRRKLHLALETTNKHDRDVVCAEVFADVTGRLNAPLQVRE